MFFAEAPEASGAAAEDQQRARYKPGDFVFGYEDVLGWIVRGITYPSCSTAIAEYMNTLEVVGCTLVTGVAADHDRERDARAVHSVLPHDAVAAAHSGR